MPPLPGAISGGLAGVGGGQGLGHAHGSITVDVASLQQMAATARVMARQTEQALNGISASAQKTETGLQRVRRGMSDLRGESLALSAVLTVVTAQSVRLAGNFQETQVLLRGMFGSARAAAEQIDRGRAAAEKYGRPLGEVLSIYTKLSPILKANADSLDRAVTLAGRLKVLNPQEDAAFAIREFLSGDPLSLIERFNIPRSQVRALAAEYGYTLAALEQLLDKMGITEELAAEMGQTFNASARRFNDALQQLVATGFTPLINALTPLLQQSADFLAMLNATNPELLAWGSGLLVAATSGAVLVTVLGQILETGIKLRNLGLFSALAGAGRAGLSIVTNPYVATGAGIAAAGIYGGNQLTRLEGRLTGDESKANRTLAEDFTILRNNIFQIIKTMVEGWGSIRGTVNNAVADWISALGEMILAMGDATAAMGALIPGWVDGGQMGVRGTLLQNVGAGLIQGGRNLREREAVQRRGERQLLTATGRALGIGNVDSGGAGEAAIQAFAEEQRAIEESINREREQAIRDYARREMEINRQAAEARLRETENYERQRTDLIRQFQLSRQREEEDFARQRARADAELARSIQAIQEAGAKQAERWARDLAQNIGRLTEASADRIEDAEEQRADRVADINRQTGRRLVEMEEQFQRQREQSAADYTKRIRDAASRFDAVAIFQEQERFAEELQERKQAYADQVAETRRSARESISEADRQLAERRAQEKEALQEQIDDAREAHEQRLADAREAESERIAEMRRAHAEQQRIEDEDRAIRRQREDDDHRARLTAMATAHDEALAEIDRQQAEAMTELVNSHAERLAALGEVLEGHKKAQDAFYEYALTRHQQFLEDLAELYPNPSHPSEADPYANMEPPVAQPPFMSGHATGGDVQRTGMAYLHRGEYVVNAARAASMRRMIGSLNAPNLGGAMAASMGASASSFVIEKGGITIHAAPGQDERRIAALVDQKIMERYQSILRGRNL